MIQVDKIKALLEEELPKLDLFLVDVTIRPGNKITVLADSMKGITLDECIAVSRFIESNLDRNEEDFELEVSSPGLDNPLKIPRQYEKNLGRWLEVVTFDGLKTTGKLTEATPERIRLEVETRANGTGKNKKAIQYVAWEKRMEDIKSAKIVIRLKK
jgi:ribosome maturation factor RimP